MKYPITRRCNAKPYGLTNVAAVASATATHRWLVHSPSCVSREERAPAARSASPSGKLPCALAHTISTATASATWRLSNRGANARDAIAQANARDVPEGRADARRFVKHRTVV